VAACYTPNPKRKPSITPPIKKQMSSTYVFVISIFVTLITLT